MSARKIVILGAGYGGLITAVRLQKMLKLNEAEVTLINKHDYHYFTTWLHSPAAGTKESERCKMSISPLLNERKINFVKDTVQEIRPEQKKIILESQRSLFYDYLVIAMGSEPETFGIEGLKEHAFTIRSINSVEKIRKHIENNFALYKKEHKEELLSFVIGGAGFTGVEFAGELSDRIPDLCSKYKIPHQLVQIHIVEAAPTVLPGFDQDLVKYAIKVLLRKGVEFKLGTPIQRCTPERVLLANGEEIKTNTIVWTGGVRGNAIVENAGFETTRGRVKVDSYLRAPNYKNVFVLGDAALFMNEETNRPYPPTAQIAIQQGEQLAQNLVALIRGGEMHPFVPALKGTVASLGKGEAIGLVGKTKLYGGTASFMKKVIDNRSLFLIGGISSLLKKGKL